MRVGMEERPKSERKEVEKFIARELGGWI